MYASNDADDWIYLHQTPPVNTLVRGVCQRIGRTRSNSSSSSSITSCSSPSNRSMSPSSELEQAQNDDVTIQTSSSATDHAALPEESTHLSGSTSIEEHSSWSDREDCSRTTCTTQLSTLPAVISAAHSDNRLPLNSKSRQAVHSPSIVLSRRRCSIGVTAEPNDFASASQLRPPSDFSRNIKWSSEVGKNDTLVSCTCIVVLLMSSFILGQIVGHWDQSTVTRISQEIDRTNHRVREVQGIPMDNMQGKLTKQLEDKLQDMVHQQLIWHDNEKSSFVRQVHDLRQILILTKQNLTDTIHRLTNDNSRLQDRIRSLEHRLGLPARKDRILHPFAANTSECTNTSTSTLDRFVTRVFKQTVSIAGNTSTHLSGLFAHLSASVSDLVDHRHHYLNRSKQKLADLTGSPAAAKVHSSFRQGLDNLSSAFRKAKVNYIAWLRSRTHERGTAMKQPWRWNFRRDLDWKRTAHQTSSRIHTFRSKVGSSMSKIRSMKNWLLRMFRA